MHHSEFLLFRRVVFIWVRKSLDILLFYRPVVFPSVLRYEDQDNLGCALTLRNVPDKTTSYCFFFMTKGGPILLSFVVIIGGYMFCLKQMKEIPPEYLAQLEYKPYYLMLYPITLIVSFLPSFILHIINMISLDQVPAWLVLLRAVFTHTIGLSNAIIYIFFRKLYQKPVTKEAIEDDNDEECRVSRFSSYDSDKYEEFQD